MVCVAAFVDRVICIVGMCIVWRFIQVTQVGGWNDVVAAVGEERDPPQSSFRVPPPSEDNFSVVRDFAASVMKK